MRIFQPIISGSIDVSGSLTVNNGITGSLYGTASYAITASYALNGGGIIDTGSLLTTASVSSNIITFTKGDGSTFPITVDTGSGGGSGAGFPFTGSAEITGSLIVTGSISSTIGFTGSLSGTASYANQAATASYVLQAVSSSFAETASYIATASYANGALSSSYALTASYADQSLSSSYAATASIATTALNTSDILVYVKNVTGATIPKGKVVRISGATGDNALISTASYEDDNNSANTLGILNESIDNDAFGYAMTEGTLLGIDTDLFTAGQLLFLGPTGSIIGYQPVPPLHNVRLGQALRIQQNNGSMYVRIDNGYELDELHNVLIISGSDGDLLVASGSNGNGKKLYINTKQLTGSYALTGSLSVIDGGVTGSLFGTSSWANNAITASYANNAISSSYSATASYLNTLNQNATISGSLTITNDLVVLGSSSIQYVTSSQLNIADNIISVNTINPAFRFGGLSVIDSGSTPQTSGSLLFDSLNNQWIFVHQSEATATTSSVLIMGPQTFNNVGNETTISTNRLTKGTGGDLGEHIGDSNITDTGTLVSINSNTQVTGSLTISGSATGSVFSVSASYLDFDFDSFLFSGSTVFQSTLDATQAVSTFGTASITFGNITGSFTGSLSGSLFGTGSWAVSASVAISASRAVSASRADSALSSSFATTASYALNAGGGGFPYTGSAIITGSLTITGRQTLTGSFSASNSESVQYINQGLVHPATTGSRIFQTTIAPVFTNNSPNQTSTALRLLPTFTGSFSGSNTQNLIVDFGASNVGSQFTVNDVTSGSIYMVNDVSGLPIIEATSNWDVNIYDYPNIVLKKTGSLVHISGSLNIRPGGITSSQTTSSLTFTIPTGSSTQDYNVGITKYRSFSYLTTTRPIYQDNYILLGYDSSGTDPELRVLTDPASGRVQCHVFSSTAATTVTSDVNVASGIVDIYPTGMGSDMRLDITISAGSDANYPFYRITMFRSNTTYGGNISVLVERFFVNQ